ncbi:src kinase-associated phosphoprotein 1-like [Pelodytes ibericus]
MEHQDLPRDVILLLRDAESFLTDCLQYEDVSSRGKEIGEQILNGFWMVRKRYQLEFQRAGDTEGYEDNHSHGTSMTSDEVSLTSDYLDDDPGDMEQLDKVLKRGYLEKRNQDHGFFGSEWQKRWCVLTKGSFCYFSSEKGKMPKGGFLIKDCSAHFVSHIRKDSRRDACFELVSPGNRSYQFTASSPAEAREWVDQIQFLVKDMLSSTIPCEDEEDDESYDDVNSVDIPVLFNSLSLDRTNSPLEDDIYEVVPDGPTSNYTDYYQGLWNCISDNSDELSFQRGDLIHILSKEYNAYGWWVGELDGAVGIVPKDYLTMSFDLEGM